MTLIVSEIEDFSPEKGREEREKLLSAVTWTAMRDVEIEEVSDPDVPGGHFTIIHTDITRPGNSHYEAAKPYMDMFSDDSDK